MFGQTWQHDILRKYVVLFGTLFNNIYVNRDDGEVKQTLKVPLNYGPKEKFLARLEGNPDLDNEIATTLPRIAFEMIAFQYAGERMRQKTTRIQKPQTNGETYWQYQPVPYDITFQMSVMTRNAQDGTRIVEQIIPKDRKSTRLNSSHSQQSRMPSSA